MAGSRDSQRGKDRELEAIGAIISLLEPLNEEERSRVLEYVLKRLEMAALRPTIAEPQQTVAVIPSTHQLMPDIRTLTAEKQPRSSNEMAALVAYYITELAPEPDRSTTVNADIIRKYFKMAAFPLPSALRNVLPNAAAAGYMENVGRGEYRLNPVGYNLVVHRLPRSASPDTAPHRPNRVRRGKSSNSRKRRH
jgi:hypothetical protein